MATTPAATAAAAPTDAPTSWERAHFHSHLVWLFAAAYACHITEESNGFAYWVRTVIHGAMQGPLFYVNNAIFMAMLIALTAVVSRRRTAGVTLMLFMFVSGQEMWNAVFHVYAENQFSAYSPGFFTAVFLYVPIYSYVTYVALRERFLSPRAWLLAIVVGLGLMLLVIWAGLYHFGAVPFDQWF